MKFVGNNHYKERIKLLHFGQNWIQEQESRVRQKILIDVNRFRVYIKQMLTPIE